MLAPPVVLVAGSSPVGQLPSNEVSLRTVSAPPRCGDPARAAAVDAPCWLHAAAPSSAATSAAISWNFVLTRVLPASATVWSLEAPRGAIGTSRHGARSTPVWPGSRTCLGRGDHTASARHSELS